MGDLNTNISVTVTGAGEVTGLAEAFERLDAAADAAEDAIGRIGGIASAGGDLGLGAMATEAEAAAGRIGTAFKSIGDSMKSLDAGSGAGAFAGIEASVKSLDDTAESLTATATETGGAIKAMGGEAGGADAQISALADTTKGLADSQESARIATAANTESLKAQAESATVARDAQLGLGDATKAQADQQAAMTALLLEHNNAMRESAALMLATPVVSAQAENAHAMADAMGAQAAATDDVTASQVVAEVQARNLQKANEASAASAAESAGKWHTAILGGAAALGYGTYLAANLQAGATRLYTSAGESQKNIPLMEQGILGMSGPTATSQASLLSGAYWAESAGFHGKDALAVLRSGAQGAYSEGADLGDTENALTTVLNDYYGGPQASAAKQQTQAVTAMNAIMASVGAGKMTLQGLASALPVLLPAAKQAGLTLPQVLGAESTMALGGTNAGEAAQLIKHTIGAIQGPSSVQAAEMQMLGINPEQLAGNLGKQGLTGTIAEADAAIKAHTKDGMVHLDTMNRSALAMQSANAEIEALPKNLQGAAKEYLAGTMGNQQWYQLTGQSKATMSTENLNLLKQFSSTANLAHGYSSLVKSGMGTEQTAAQALNKLMGGQEGQQVALGLGGSHLKTFGDNVKTIGDQSKATGDNIRGWSAVQGELNYKLKDTEYSLEAFATEAGQLALPLVTKALGGASDVLSLATSHPAVTKDVLTGAAILAIPAALSKVESAGTTIAASAGKIGQTLGIPGADKLANLGQSSSGAAGAEALDGSAARLSGAAGELSGAAGRLSGAADENALPGGKTGTIPGEEGGPGVAPIAGTEKAAAESEGLGEDAAELGGGALGLGAIAKMLPAAARDIAGSANPIGMGVAASLFAKGLGDHLAPKGTMPGAENQVSQHTADPTANAVNFIIGGYLAKAFSSHALSPQQSGMGQGSVADARLGALPPAQATQGPVTAAQAYGESAIAPPRALPASTAAALAKTAATDVKLKVSVDDAALGAAKAHITSMLTALSGGQVKPVKIPAPDLTAVEQAKSKVSADMGAITGAMSAGAGAAAAAGSAVSSGFAGGIAAGEGAAVAAARQVAGAAAAAMATQVQARSPSKVTEKTGKDTADGFIGSLAAAAPDAAVAGAKVADAATTAMKKAAAAKVTISASTATSLITGLQGGQDAITAAQSLAKGIAAPFKDSTIADTAAKLQTDITNALKDHQITAAEASGMKDYVNAETAQLQRLAGQRNTLEQQIQAANSFGQQTTAAANQGANIMTIAGNIQSADTSTSAPAPPPQYQASDLVSGMQAQVSATKQFTADLGKLKKEGLNKAEIQQIASAGAQAGDPVAQAILQGGPGSIKQLNQLASEMNKAAQALGKTAENAAYDPGKDKTQLKGVDASIKGIATQEVSALKNALSSSAAAADFSGAGANIAGKISNAIEAAFSAPSMAGLVAAIEAALEGVAKADAAGGGSGGSAGKSKTPPHHAPPQSDATSHPAMAAAGVAPGGSAGGGYAGPSRGGDTHIHTHVHAGAVISEGDLMRTVRAQAMNNASNNTMGGWQFPGRRV